MNELLIFIQSLPTAMKTGLIYSIMVMGVYITYKILDFPDLSVDGTFPLGGFIFAAFSLSKLPRLICLFLYVKEATKRSFPFESTLLYTPFSKFST